MAANFSISSLKRKLELSFEKLIANRTHPWSIRLLRKAVYGWFLIHTLILLPAAAEFWAPGSLIPHIDPVFVNGNRWLHLLSLPSVEPYYMLFIVAQLILLVLGVLCVYPRLVSILLYFVTMNLDSKVYVILDGGNNLMQLVLVYMIFMDPSKPSPVAKHSWWTHLNNSFSNLAFLTCRLQVVMVYFVSGLSKISGELWQNGTALYYTLNVDEYTHPVAKNLVAQYPILTVLGTYVTLLYQVSFPWLVWNTRIRPYLLTIGVLIHLQISFVMGLFMFGFAIAVAYLSFSTNESAGKVLLRIAGWVNSMNRLFNWIKNKIIAKKTLLPGRVFNK